MFAQDNQTDQNRQQFQQNTQQQQLVHHISSMGLEQQSQTSTMQIEETTSFEYKIKEFRNTNFNTQQFNQLRQCFESQDIEKMHYGIIGIRKILSKSQNIFIIQQIIESGLITRIIQFVKQQEYVILQVEAIWCIANIVSGTQLQTSFITDKMELKIFVQLLKSNNEQVNLNCIWTIANIVADSAIFRDSLINYRILDILCDLINKTENISIIQESCWCISNIIFCKPKVKHQNGQNVIKVLANLIIKGKIVKHQTIRQCMKIFSQLISQNNSRIFDLKQTGILPKLIEFLNFNNLAFDSLVIFSHISFGNSIIIQNLIDNNFLKQLDQIFDKSDRKNIKQICFILSNIVSSPTHIKFIFDNHESLVQKILNIFRAQQTLLLKQQIAIFFQNIIIYGNCYEIISFYHDNEITKIYLNLLSYQNNHNIVLMSLEAIDCCLDLGQKTKQLFNGKSIIFQDLIKNNGAQALQSMQLHPNHKIYIKTNEILNKYFEIA